jgi:hypothetical protein
MVLAMWAVAMTAGMGNKALVLAVGTADLHDRAEFCPANFKGIQRLSLSRQNLALIAVKKIRFKLIDHGRK